MNSKNRLAGFLLLICTVILAACAPGGTETPATPAPPSAADATNPTIAITIPSATGSFASTISTVAVSGTASDNVGVQTVTWTNNRGGSGPASGTTAWTVSAVALVSGANVITMTAADAAGNQSQAVLTVTYTPPVADVTAPVVAITTPTSAATFSANAAALSLGGTATDAVGVTTVTWANNRGGSGTASGTANWTVNTVTLMTGINVITVTAVDAAGNQGQDTLTVTYTPPSGVVVTVDDSVRFQTIHGWEASAQAGHDAMDGTVAQPYRFNEYSNAVFDLAVNELGISRLRVHVRSGVENPTDHWALYQNGTITRAQYRQLRYQIVNDDAVPTTITASGYQFSDLDDVVNKVVLPLKQRVEARGERLFINVCYTSFHGSAGITTSLHASNAAEYGEFVLATVQHLQATFGWVPDAWEVMLEPDHSTGSPVWNGTTNGVFLGNGGTLVGNAIAAAGARLQAAGFGSIKFIAPSTTDMSMANTYFDQMIAVPGVIPLLYELSYHRYKGISDTALQGIAARAQANGIGTSMLEHDGSGQGALPADDELRSDLTTGMNSAWQQFTLAFPNNGDVTTRGAYMALNSPPAPAPYSVQLTNSAKFLRQYFYFVRPGAIRVSAASTDLTIWPLAFINANGKRVVAVKTNGAATFSITGLPAGVYGINYTTTTQYNVNATDATLTAGQALPVSMPGNGVITIYGR